MKYAVSHYNNGMLYHKTMTYPINDTKQPYTPYTGHNVQELLDAMMKQARHMPSHYIGLMQWIINWCETKDITVTKNVHPLLNQFYNDYHQHLCNYLDRVCHEGYPITSPTGFVRYLERYLHQPSTPHDYQYDQQQLQPYLMINDCLEGMDTYKCNMILEQEDYQPEAFTRLCINRYMEQIIKEYDHTPTHVQHNTAYGQFMEACQHSTLPIETLVQRIMNVFDDLYINPHRIKQDLLQHAQKSAST